MDALTIRARPRRRGGAERAHPADGAAANARDYAAPVVELIGANYAPDKVAPRLVERDIFVCLEGHRIVGTIGLESDRLRSLFVEPGLQGKGVGARLVAHLEAHARQAGVAELQLSSSITARRFTSASVTG